MRSHSAAAFTVRSGWPVVRAVSAHSRSSATAFRKSSVTRTELLAFWPDTVA
jgi:hypothetical protein